MTSALRLPPFGGELVGTIQRKPLRSFFGTSPDGRHETYFVLAGEKSWERAQQWRRGSRLFVLAPPKEDPARFNWNCVTRSDPVLLVVCGTIDGEFVRRLVAAMFRDGVECVLDMRTGLRYVAAGIGTAA